MATHRETTRGHSMHSRLNLSHVPAPSYSGTMPSIILNIDSYNAMSTTCPATRVRAIVRERERQWKEQEQECELCELTCPCVRVRVCAVQCGRDLRCASHYTARHSMWLADKMDGAAEANWQGSNCTSTHEYTWHGPACPPFCRASSASNTPNAPCMPATVSPRLRLGRTGTSFGKPLMYRNPL